MFWSKARKIKELKLALQASEIGAKAMERMRDTARTALTPALARVEELEQGLKFANQTNSALAAERDQLHKRVEELEQQSIARDLVEKGNQFDENPQRGKLDE